MAHEKNVRMEVCVALRVRGAPAADEVALWLVKRWKAPKAHAHEIALGCGGCVRAALADLESAYDMGAVA